MQTRLSVALLRFVVLTSAGGNKSCLPAQFRGGDYHGSGGDSSCEAGGTASPRGSSTARSLILTTRGDRHEEEGQVTDLLMMRRRRSRQRDACDLSLARATSHRFDVRCELQALAAFTPAAGVGGRQKGRHVGACLQAWLSLVRNGPSQLHSTYLGSCAATSEGCRWTVPAFHFRALSPNRRPG